LKKFIIVSKGPLASFAVPFCIALRSVVEVVVLSPVVNDGELVFPAVVRLEAENDVDDRLSVPWEEADDVKLSVPWEEADDVKLSVPWEEADDVRFS
jgi:hypothetical protein